jgi:hypothetical protein
MGSMLGSYNLAIFLLLVLSLALMTKKTAYFRATLHEPVTTSKAGINGWVLTTWHDSSMLARGQIFLHLEIAENIFERVELPAGVNGPSVDQKKRVF